MLLDAEANELQTKFVRKIGASCRKSRHQNILKFSKYSWAGLLTEKFRLNLWDKLVQLFQSFCTIARLVPFLIQLYIQRNFQGGPEGWL